jgi:rhamnosyltransferase
MNNKEYAIGLVVFHPGRNVLKRINIMLALGYMVYIFDNSPFEDGICNEIKKLNVIYITAGKNIGLGYSLATICATAYSNGHSHLLYLDQDTGIGEKTLEFIKTFKESLSINIINEYAALVFSDKPKSNQLLNSVHLAINSGSLYNLYSLKLIGWHNETYFLDCVDYEFCLRARHSGFKIGLIKSVPDFDHISEQPDYIFKIFNKAMIVRNYPVKQIIITIKAYLKLIIISLLRVQIIDSCQVARSLGIYIFGQIASRVIKKN